MLGPQHFRRLESGLMHRQLALDRELHERAETAARVAEVCQFGRYTRWLTGPMLCVGG